MIKGRYPYQKIFFQNNQLGMLTKERGVISLTINGANKIIKSNKYCIEIFDNFILKGSLFAPGIKKADKDIRIGDEVLILKNEKLCGVGVAQMSGIEMMKLNYGEAVKVRHKV
jgi:archaeosine synthase